MWSSCAKLWKAPGTNRRAVSLGHSGGFPQATISIFRTDNDLSDLSFRFNPSALVALCVIAVPLSTLSRNSFHTLSQPVTHMFDVS